MTTKNTDQLKKVTGMTEIPYVSEGIAAETSGFVIHEDGLTSLVEASAANEANSSAVAALQSQLDAANTASQNAEAALATANANLATANESIETLQDRVTELEAIDAGDGSGTGKKEDAFQKVETAAIEMDFEKEIRSRIE